MEAIAAARRWATEWARGPLAVVPVFAAPGPDPRPGRHFGPPRWLRVVSEQVSSAGQAPQTGKLCTCGHGKPAHSHYRAGTDCSLCGCERFDRPLMSRLGFRRPR
jgi:hypothetical protein